MQDVTFARHAVTLCARGALTATSCSLRSQARVRSVRTKIAELPSRRRRVANLQSEVSHRFHSTVTKSEITGINGIVCYDGDKM